MVVVQEEEVEQGEKEEEEEDEYGTGSCVKEPQNDRS